MKKFCKYLREYAMDIINFKKKKDRVEKIKQNKIKNKNSKNNIKMHKFRIFVKRNLSIRC